MKTSERLDLKSNALINDIYKTFITCIFMDFIKSELDKEFEIVGFKNQRRTLKWRDHQIGKSIKEIDIKRKALLPGKRISKNGNTYYEYRKNRSDKKGKKI